MTIALTLAAARGRAEEEFQFRVESNLRAAVAKVDITPPPDTPVVGHVRPTNGVRDPIRAGVLLLSNGDAQAAIVTLDLIKAPSDLVAELRDAIARRTEIPAENILVAASHNHSGPGWSRESQWGREMVHKIGDAAAQAASEMRPVTIGYICTAESHQYGGYEPGMSPLLPEAEPLILAELGRLADKALADVFESYAPKQ